MTSDSLSRGPSQPCLLCQPFCPSRWTLKYDTLYGAGLCKFHSISHACNPHNSKFLVEMDWHQQAAKCDMVYLIHSINPETRKAYIMPCLIISVSSCADTAFFSNCSYRHLLLENVISLMRSSICIASAWWWVAAAPFALLFVLMHWHSPAHWEHVPDFL